MEYNNFNINDISKYQNSDKNVKYYEVLTDGDYFWVYSDTLVEICKGFDSSLLTEFKFKMDRNIVLGKDYVSIEESFLNFIKNNTYMPKYCPQFTLLKAYTREFENQSDLRMQQVTKQSIRLDGTLEYENECMQKSR